MTKHYAALVSIISLKNIIEINSSRELETSIKNLNSSITTGFSIKVSFC
jgi:hypothetical protein